MEFYLHQISRENKTMNDICDQSFFENHGDGGYEAEDPIFILGLPIIISNLSRTIMDLADMAMVAGINNGANALAAVGFSGMLTWILISMGLSIRVSTQTIASRRLGQKKYTECSLALRNGHILALMLGLPLSIKNLFQKIN